MTQLPSPTGHSAQDARDLRLMAWIGAGLLAGGMPVHEVEEDIHEVAWTLGHQRPQVGCAPGHIMVALSSGGPSTFEKVDGNLRLDQLADVSAIQARVRAARMDPDAALERLASLRRQPNRYSLVGVIIGAMLTGIGIGLILAPALSSFLFTVAVAPLTALLILLLGTPGRAVRTLVPLLAGFSVALPAFAATQQGWIEAPLWTLVAPIAVILPGALIVTGLSELASGSMVAGSARLSFGLTQLLLFTLGVAAAFTLVGPDAEVLNAPRPESLGWWAPMIGVFIISTAITLMEAVPLPSVPWVLATILVTYVAQTITVEAVDARWAGALVGAVAASLTATLIEYTKPHVPRMVAFLPSFWLLVPGSLGLMSIAQLEVGPSAAVTAVVEVTVVVTAVALGVVIGSALASPLRHIARQFGVASLLRRRYVRAKG